MSHSNFPSDKSNLIRVKLARSESECARIDRTRKMRFFGKSIYLSTKNFQTNFNYMKSKFGNYLEVKIKYHISYFRENCYIKNKAV